MGVHLQNSDNHHVYNKMRRREFNQVNIERIGVLAVSGSENADFDWCNTNNHMERRGVSDQEYHRHISRTSLDKWLPVLGHLCGPLSQTAFPSNFRLCKSWCSCS